MYESVLQDNARSNTINQTCVKLKELCWKTNEHRSDLLPFHYHILGPLNDTLGEHPLHSGGGVREQIVLQLPY